MRPAHPRAQSSDDAGKDRYRAARFYIVALGAEAHHESAPDRAAKGLARSLQVGVRLAAGFEIDLFEQSFGQPDWNQSHPHLALDTSAGRFGKMDGAFREMANSFCRSDDARRHQRRGNLFQRPGWQPSGNSLFRCPANAARALPRSARMTRVTACTSKSGRPKN